MVNDKNSRRNMMKKSAAFVLPTLVTFQLASLKVQASGSYNSHSISTQGSNGNKGNHYGNNKGDRNPKDVKNKHNTAF